MAWMRRHPFAAVSIVGLVVALTAFSVPDPSGAATIWTWVGTAGMFSSVGAPVVFYIRQTARAIDMAMKSVPTPEQIRLQFMQTQGREPTLQEVAALHQMLQSQHNQSLVQAGVLVGGAVLGAWTVARRS